MRFFFDTEFIEDGKTIELISIGMVAEDGRGLYLESADVDLNLAGDWVKANVLPHLQGGNRRVPREVIAERVRNFIMRGQIDTNAQTEPEIWAYYADYDWVALCQLYGTMLDLPPGWPMFCRDLKQLAVMVGNPELPKQRQVEHHALADAQWNYDTYQFLRGRWYELYGRALDAAGPRE